ncbi:N,N'-diacetylchitobiose phosphorylase [mine drainage metagenome]|uniref:N,N'-diacetylchitobiose phosphorylase n=1 Tax=mine drainage metagenome TaxID=410659 RepID=A0A1J5Q5B4_9ZZZZ
MAQACRALATAPDDAQALQGALHDSQLRIQPLLGQRQQRGTNARDQLRWLQQDHRALLKSSKRSYILMSKTGQQQTVLRLPTLADHLETLAWQPDFKFLYHAKRRLLHIGYRPTEQQLDAGFYDLLASEARLTSLIAIAKGDVPVAHWSALGRMFCVLQGQAGLRSWSGSMFEYLMPGLVIAEPAGSVLADACAMALREQMAFAKPLRVPWGMSESAFAARDQSLAYQYAPQGVPRLALRRTPVDELVIAPYACVLAAQILPLRSWRNLQTLESLGARQRYGYLEALDYTPARQTAPGAFTAVGTFMAHHQGMSIAALANVLLGGVVQRWGMADPRLQAISSLLHERTPREISILYTLPSGLPPQMLRKRQPGLLRRVTPGVAAVEPTHMLSNGHYSVALRANGAGASRWGRISISRWRDDLLRDGYGHFFYLDRLRLNRHGLAKPLVSLTQHPAADPDADYQSTFHADRVCFNTEWKQLTTQMTVWVSPEDDIEFRQVELHNRTLEVLELEVLSAFELTLADARADEAHPAFSGMFVRARWQPKHRALVLERKPRIATDTPVHAAHFLAHTDHDVLGLRVCTSRAQWLGRNRDASNPLAQLHEVVTERDALETTQEVDQDTELDPVCVLAARIRIAPLGRATLIFATAAAANGDTLHAVLDKYLQCSHIQRSSLMSATLASIRLRALQISAEQFATLQSLCTALLWSVGRPDRRVLARSSPSRTVCDRRLLWRFGISGDRPILLVSVGVVQGAGMLRSLAKALRLWSWSGLACDLVVLNFEPNSYAMALQREIASISERLAADAVTSTSLTALHLLRAQELSSDEVSTLHNLARLHLHADGRPLAHHLQEWLALHEAALEKRDESHPVVIPITRARLAVTASKGAFDAKTGAFSFAVSASVRPQRPWSNVLANPDFGSVLTESGGGFSWAANSRLHQITAWSNDPVSDPCAEWFVLQDTRTDAAWSLTPNALGDASAKYLVSHGQGTTTITHQRGDLAVEVTWCVDPVHCVKSVRIALHNTAAQAQRLRLLGLVEWIMGANRTDRNTCVTSVQRSSDSKTLSTSLLCNQRSQEGGFGDTTAFLTLSCARSDGREEATWTSDRREFFNSGGQMVLPQTLGARCGEGLDPCAAIAIAFRIDAGARTEFSFCLGHAPTLIAANAMLLSINEEKTLGTQAAVSTYWEALLGNCTVHTPDPLLDVLVNRWLLYQTVSCRLWSKAGFYQAGGATGFRDQLQDTMALAWSAPATLRQQIVLCASRQFAQGDVQHWWHAPTGVGVRTHFSDDLLWLPHALVHYLRATDDVGVLEQCIPFLEGPAIVAGAEDAYFTPTISQEQASVWEHAARTIDASLRVGAHGLPLIGSGDWNDGMNAVGHEGRGESVWLGWFLCQIVAHMAPRARERGELPRAQRWEAAAAGCKEALAGEAWDGHWFRRAFFDDGEVLGSAANAECRIDLIAQAWSVLSDVASVPMQVLAMDSAQAQLVDGEAGLVKLLAPPLQNSQPSAGYIQAYPPGVRENGGQYAHAAVWALMAQVRLHHSGSAFSADGVPRCDLAYRYFTCLSPAHRSAHAHYGPRYGLEPYAMAADVYGAPPYEGRGGWSWYTGSAGWMYRLIVESLLGLRREGGHLHLAPVLPADWPGFELDYRYGSTLYCIRVGRTLSSTNPAEVTAQILLDGVVQSAASIALLDDGRSHQVELRLA